VVFYCFPIRKKHARCRLRFAFFFFEYSAGKDGFYVIGLKGRVMIKGLGNRNDSGKKNGHSFCGHDVFF